MLIKCSFFYKKCFLALFVGFSMMLFSFITCGVALAVDIAPVNGIQTSVSTLSAKLSQVYTLEVPANATSLNFVTVGGTGDADLYVKKWSVPTSTDRECASESSSSNETCTITSISAGTYYAVVFAYNDISGVSITGSYDQSVSSAPYNDTPDWTSGAPHQVSTGGGIADINGDGWDDLVVADGNDMQQQHVVVYYNQGDGTFPTSPSWSSNDTDYHGLLSIGDIDGNGFPDVAVSVFIGTGGMDVKGYVKVYFNYGGTLESTPSWRSANDYYAFQCELGDANGDGDLDLGVATGNMYRPSTKLGALIFYNTNGALETVPSWQSSQSIIANTVEFADMDGNGYLDFVIGCQDCPNYVHLADGSGQISTKYQWRSTESQMATNSIVIAKFGSDDYLDIASSGNNQLPAGDGKTRLHSFNAPPSGQSLGSWATQVGRQYSAIEAEDLDGDGYNDLLLGMWWGPIRLYQGTPSNLSATPIWTSNTNSVL